MADPIVAADLWLHGTLTNDPTLQPIIGNQAYGHVVPPGATLPYLLWTLIDANDDLTALGAQRIWTGMLYAVRLIDKVEDYAPLEVGAAAITAALHRASGTNVSGVIFACIKEAPFAMPEIENDGSQLRHLGGRFRLYVQ